MNFEKAKLTEELFNEALPLLRAHFEEIYPDEEMTLSFAVYAELAKTGAYRIFTMRDEYKLIQGYAGFYVHPHPHKKRSIEALCDLLYVTPEFRNQGHGRDLIQFCERELKAEGCHAVMIAVPKEKNFSTLLQSMEYQPSELMMRRAL